MLEYGLYGKEISSSFNSAYTSISQKVKPLIIVDWLDSRHVDKSGNTEIASTTSTLSQPTSAFVQSSASGMLANSRSLSEREIQFNRSRHANFYFTPNESINGIERQSFTWAVCDAKDVNGKVITANGQWHCLPSTKDENYEFGYQSSSKSTSSPHATLNGYSFSSPIVMTYVFTERKVNVINIITSEYNGQIKSYNVKAYNQTVNLVYNEDAEIPEDSYFLEHNLIGVSSNNINKIVVTVYTTKNPLDYARVNEVCPIYREDMTDYVINFDVSKVRDVHETSLPIGGSGSSTSSITFDNGGKDFNLFSSSSTYGKYMKKDIRVKVSAGWGIGSANQESASAVLSANITSTSNVWTVNSVNDFPAGGVGDDYILTINSGNIYKERVLARKGTGNSFDIIERGIGGTVAISHSAGSAIFFDAFEYAPYGIFYVDEWQGSSSSMTVSANLTDRSKFGQEKMITKGFLLQEVTVAEAVEHLTLMTNYPKSDIEYLLNPAKTYTKSNCILHFGFDEKDVDRASAQRIVSSSLRARIVEIPSTDLNSVRDIKLDANDKNRSSYEKALDINGFIAPSLTTTSKEISSNSVVALNFVSGNFTSKNNDVIDSYFNGVFDGHYIPAESGLRNIVISINKGGVRVYLNKIKIIDEWYVIDTGTNTPEVLYSDSYDMVAGKPYELRIEFFTEQHIENEPFKISLLTEYDSTLYYIDSSECYTMVAGDRIGVKNESSYLTFASNTWTPTANVDYVNRSSRTNDAIYIGPVKISEPSGVVSDQESKSILLESNSYLRVPYHISYDVTNSSSASHTGTFSIELYAKFNNGPFSSDGEYVSNWNNSTSTSGFEFFNNASENGFKIKVLAANSVVITETVSSNSSLSNSSFSHVSVTYDGSSLRYYTNGVLRDTEVVNGTPIAWSSKDVCIGGRGASFSAGAEQPPSAFRSFYIDEFAIFNKSFSDKEVLNHYIETQMQPVRIMPFIYGNDATVQELIDNISLADLGRFYIDENGIAKYEHYHRFFESSIAQHANTQFTLSDTSNIIDASYAVQLQTNKVVVKVNKVANNLVSKQGLWRAEDPTTLGVTSLSSNVSNSATSINVVSTDNPFFPKSGFLKINDEIIKYSGISSNSFTSVERAQFDTVASSHSTTNLVREVKKYDLLYDKSPAFRVENPLITNLSLVNPPKVEMITFNPTPYGALLIVAASNNTVSGEIVYLEGENPLTNEKNFASIAGIPVVFTENTGDVKEKKAVLDDNIRKYGLKELIIENEFITDLDHAQRLATFIIDKMSEPVPIINLNITPIPTMQLGDRIRISSMDSFDIIDGDYWVISSDFSYSETLSQSIVIRKVV
jgi:hypothetical protein